MADRNKQAKLREQAKFAQITAYNKVGKHMLDSTGKQLKVGQIVDIPLNGMFRGHIVQAAESALVAPGRPPQPPHVMVELHIPRVALDALGHVQSAYIVAEPPDVPDIAPGTAASAAQVSGPALVEDKKVLITD